MEKIIKILVNILVYHDLCVKMFIYCIYWLFTQCAKSFYVFVSLLTESASPVACFTNVCNNMQVSYSTVDYFTRHN